MDLVASCREKLGRFRVKELKDVLTELGLSKQGKKQDLMDRILALLSDEQVFTVPNMHVWMRRKFIGKEEAAKIIDDTYRKMQISAAPILASYGHYSSNFNHAKSKEEVDLSMLEAKSFLCVCGESTYHGSTIQCEDPKCQVQQHIACVIVPDKPTQGDSPEIPSHFYCEICRINRADPFWVTMRHILPPVKIFSSNITADGTITLLDRTFHLSRLDWELIQKPEYDLQVWCLLLNDKVKFRMQWPQHAELLVNDVAVRVLNRPGAQLLGINGRDDGAVITAWSREGTNKITLLRCDTRIFCFGIRLARKRTVSEVLDLVPKKEEGEQFEDALTRVCRCVGGGTPKESADSDSDLEVVADSVTVSLRCPMSGSRMRIAGRFRPCVHMRCFDLETFIELNQHSRKWQCPICLKNYSLENIIIDPFFNLITSALQNCAEDVTDIDVKPDGCWRVKNETEFEHLAKWHLPAGALCDVSDAEFKLDLSKLIHIRQGSPVESDIGMNMGMNPNSNTIFEVCRPQDNRLPYSGSHVPPRFEDYSQERIQRSSSITESYRDGEDPSINQEIAFDISFDNTLEFDSFSFNSDPLYSIDDRIVPLEDPHVILLSGSEDNLILMSHDAVYDTQSAGDSIIPFPNLPGVSERCIENAVPETNVTSCPRQYNNDTDEFEMPIWPVETCPHLGPGYQLFAADVPNVLANSHLSLGCAPINSYSLSSNDALADTHQVEDISNFHSHTGTIRSLVDNPLTFASNDPSLHILPSSQPVGVALQDDLIDDTNILNGISSDDWVSFRDTAGGVHDDAAFSNGSTSRKQAISKESQMDFSDDPGTLLFTMYSYEVNKVKLKR
ncbi:hypothetical protein Cni_G09382 [Canna indica]|uniref:E3 SUMO-protein ligase SIZ1 n=1 Tax=Canna indica TaxID=4628 RepID=A0AAQ3K283_9LILI|nr:hypothetical protein Cni_G09382 [Canna indica]